ncbi:MAG: arginine--tRNA ligase [Proteobacteria bacterium]|nr:arginine--tRNA ligase [Pseudomonadota bacterium]
MTTIQSVQTELQEIIAAACRGLGGTEIAASSVALSPVPETSFGDIAMACFALRGKLLGLPEGLRNNPAAIAKALAEALAECDRFEEVRAEGPYVNMAYKPAWLSRIVLGEILAKGDHFGDMPRRHEKIVIEFSGPNTNKPQHLGHLRNNVIGESMSRLLDKAGYDVVRVNIINDRGIHICKSMLAYMQHGEGATPASTGIKGDHLVGGFYVRFEQAFQEEFGAWLGSDDGLATFEVWKASDAGQKVQKAIDAYEALPAEKKKSKPPADLPSAFRAAIKDRYFNEKSALGRAATALLVRWEDGDEEVHALWQKLNGWVIDGFLETYQTLGITFDKLYFESETYKLGKDCIAEGLAHGIFHRLADNAVAFDLNQMGLSGDKIVLRANGTSVYITQDIGTAIERYHDFAYDRMIYVVADEQNHHFRVLFGILAKLREDLANRFEHLSYGMVTLPSGRMKSREGTVVDTDCLIEEITGLVREVMENKSDREHYAEADETEIGHRAKTIALAAVKYFLLDVTPASWMEFCPHRSIDLQGRTGAYCLMNYARTRSILRKAGYVPAELGEDTFAALKTPHEKRVLLTLMRFGSTLQWAAESRDPAKLAEFLFHLCKSFAFIFTDKTGHPILTCDSAATKRARLALVDALGRVLKIGLNLLGIDILEEM